jgi:hypothetical protein
MTKYTFTQEYEDGTKTTHEFYADTHPEVTEHYQLFMRGAGFYYNEGDYYGLLNDNWQTAPAELSQSDDEWFEEEYEEDCGGSATEEYKNLDHSAAWPFPHAYTPTPQKEDGSLPFSNFGGERCNICGFTRQEMGQNICYDNRCPLGLNPKKDGPELEGEWRYA